ncbi:MAG: hypothetical protein JXQ75_00305 [Phycisphaerae bacterium]|nr:hypothetical protein [Phycisphaerae bacterium]
MRRQQTEDNLDATRLVELLKHQDALYRRLRVLADRQKSLVAEDDARPLLSLLAERQKLVDGLVGLNAKLAPYRKEWTGVYGSLDEPTRGQVAELLERANSALGAVLRGDQRDTAALSAKRQDMVGRVAAMDSGSRAKAAYCSAGSDTRKSMTDAEA